MHSLYVPYAMDMKKMKCTFYYIVLYTMTHARNIYALTRRNDYISGTVIENI